ncbi:MAG: hypothetical protein WDO73_25800 [Ignavibacteriota bacterium]
MIDAGGNGFHRHVEIAGEGKPEGLQELLVDRVHESDAVGRQTVWIADVVSGWRGRPGSDDG